MLLDAWRNRGVSVKAVSFAMIGVVNTLVDYGVFLLARAVLSGSPAGLATVGSLNDFCLGVESVALLMETSPAR